MQGSLVPFRSGYKSRGKRTHAWILIAVLASSPTTAFPQESGIDAARLSPTLYYPSAASELTSRDALHVRVESLLKDVASSAQDSLPTLLNTVEETLVALQRHAAYLRVQTLEDTTNQSAKASAEAVSTDMSVLRAALRNRLMEVPRDRIPGLGRYARLAEQAQRDAAHAFSQDAARYRGLLTVPVKASIANAYNRLIAAISNQGTSSRDLATRRAAIASREGAYDSSAPVAAALLATLVEIENRDAAAQGYANGADRKYSSLQLSDALVRQTLSAVEAEAPVYREYEQVLAEHAARKLGVSPVLAAEKDLAGTSSPRIALTQARQFILDALQPLGAEYTRRFAQLLDPANGRLDLAGGSHRARTGTSIAVYDAPVAFFFTGYDGSLTSVSTIAHEGGHAIHRELLNAGGAPVYERNGPNYLFEGFAIFNELLVLNHAAKIAKTPEERAYALERLLWKLSVELFISAEEAAFERSLYTAASGHALLNRADVDSIFRESVSRYEYWPLAEIGASREWMRKSLLFEDPLYLVNYLYAAVVAVALYDRMQIDRDFASKYDALLRHGFDAEPQALLASLNIRLDDPELVKAASRLILSKTAELRDLYQADGPGAR